MTAIHVAAGESAFYVPHALVALAAAGLVACLSWKSAVLRRRGVRASGVCVKQTYGRHGVAPVVEFETPTGDRVRCLGRPAAAPSVRVGGRATVVFDPKNPTNAQVEPVTSGALYGLAVLAVVCAVPGAALLCWALLG